MTNSKTHSLFLLFQLQSLSIQLQTEFAWDKKNSWVNRGEDGRFQGGKGVVQKAKDTTYIARNKLAEDGEKLKEEFKNKTEDIKNELERLIRHGKNSKKDEPEENLKNDEIEQIKELNTNEDLKNGLIFTASLMGISALSLLGLRARYIHNFDAVMKEKALIRAEEIMEELPSRLAPSKNAPTSKSATIVINGSVVEKGREKATARAVTSIIQKMLPSHKIIPLITDDTHVKIPQELADELFHSVTSPKSMVNLKFEMLKIRMEIYKGAARNFVKGENPAAIEAAAQAIAHAKKYKVPVNGVGHCFGGLHLHDAQMIAKAAGVDLDVVALGTPYFGMTKSVSRSKTLVSPNDELAKLPFWVSRDKAVVSGVEDHDSYLLSPNVSQEIREFLEVK